MNLYGFPYLGIFKGKLDIYYTEQFSESYFLSFVSTLIFENALAIHSINQIKFL